MAIIKRPVLVAVSAHGSASERNCPPIPLKRLFAQQHEGTFLDRLTHHIHILELNSESYGLKHSKARRRRDPRPADEAADPETGGITPDS